MIRRLRIALLIESSFAYSQDLKLGIAAYGRAHGPWSFYHQRRDFQDPIPSWLKSWNCDGILARIESHKQIEQFRKINIPTVDLFGAYDINGIPSVDNDNAAVAHMAANELISRGFKHFAFCEYPSVHFSEQRRDAFIEYLNEQGYEVDCFCKPYSTRTRDVSKAEIKTLLEEERLAEWLKALPKPVGLMACDDIRAQQVLNACGQHNISVPDDVAVIGVDNDLVLCELSDPPLTSIDPNTKRIGYESASLLHQMISGAEPQSHKVLIKPKHVVVRQSTDVSVTTDRDVAAAVQFIRENACNGIQVVDIVRHLAVSRSTLERRFANALGRSPSAEIIRVQINRAKELLQTTDFPLSKIAQIAGFSYVESMCSLFKRNTGKTMGQYREETQNCL